MAILKAHSGSWTIPGTNIHLPDIGLTEKLADFFGQSRNPQGGSQLRQGTVFNVGNVPYAVNQPIKSSNVSYTPDTLGGFYQYNVPQKTSTQSPPSQNTGGGNTQPSAPSGGSPAGGNFFEMVKRLNVGDIINIGGKDYRVFDPGKGGIEPYWQGQGWEEEKRVNAIRGQIESEYNAVASILDEIAGLVPQREAEERRRLEQWKQSGLSGLETAKQTSLSNLALAEKGVKDQYDQGERSVYNSLRNLLTSGQQKIGLAGAGQSSANEMINYALGKQAARSLADLRGQQIGQLNQIEMKKNDVINTFETAKSQLEQDFQDKLTEIGRTYAEYLDQIRMQKANAGARKAQALASLEAQLLNNLQQEALMLKQNFLNQSNLIQQWAMDRLSTIDNAKIAIGEKSMFQPQQLVPLAMQGLDVEMSPSYIGQGDLASLLSMAAARRKNYQDLFNI